MVGGKVVVCWSIVVVEEEIRVESRLLGPVAMALTSLLPCLRAVFETFTILRDSSPFPLPTQHVASTLSIKPPTLSDFVASIQVSSPDSVAVPRCICLTEMTSASVARVRSPSLFFDTPTREDILAFDRQVHDVDTGTEAGLAAAPPDRRAHRGPRPLPQSPTPNYIGVSRTALVSPIVTISRLRG